MTETNLYKKLMAQGKIAEALYLSLYTSESYVGFDGSNDKPRWNPDFSGEHGWVEVKSYNPAYPQSVTWIAEERKWQLENISNLQLWTNYGTTGYWIDLSTCKFVYIPPGRYNGSGRGFYSVRWRSDER